MKGGTAPRARYLRDDQIGTIRMRQAVNREHRHDVRAAWDRSSALASSVFQNSGRLAGALEQVITDTVGTGLVLNARPDWTNVRGGDRTEFIRIVERRWRQWSNNPIECDLRGKQTIDQMIDTFIRWYLIYGEFFSLMPYMNPAVRQRRGAQTGLKVCAVNPLRVPRVTREMEGLYEGIWHDAEGMPTHLRVREYRDGIWQQDDHRMRDNTGLSLAHHGMMGESGDVRGITPMAPAIKDWLTYDQATDSTNALLLIQSLFAATLKSGALDRDALEGILTFADELGQKDGYASEDGNLPLDYLLNRYESAAEKGIHVGEHGRINVLAPGDEFQFHTPGGSAQSYMPLATNMMRSVARCLGITFSSFAMDHNGATYTSVRMETSTIWPVAVRRKSRLAAPAKQAIYEAWLDEEVGEGRIPFPGGYRAFRAQRHAICAAEWIGPAKPVADDLKAAKAASERLANRTSTNEDEIQERGGDPESIFERQLLEHQRFIENGMTSPYERNPSATGGDGAFDGNGDPVQDARLGESTA